MAKIDGVVVAEELADVKWASTPVWIDIHHGRRQGNLVTFVFV
jgi:hypothetical protein